jgi:hypothetical protein
MARKTKPRVVPLLAPAWGRRVITRDAYDPFGDSVDPPHVSERGKVKPTPKPHPTKR